MGSNFSEYSGEPAYYWEELNARDHVLHNAVIGGKDIDGVPIYIGLAEHRRDTLPAHVDPRRKTVHVSWGGKQVSCSRYELLVQKEFHWVSSSGGKIPRDAVPAGVARSRWLSEETLYVGRVYHSGHLRIGKVHPSHGVLYISYKGKELKYKKYEILVFS